MALHSKTFTESAHLFFFTTVTSIMDSSHSVSRLFLGLPPTLFSLPASGFPPMFYSQFSTEQPERSFKSNQVLCYSAQNPKPPTTLSKAKSFLWCRRPNRFGNSIPATDSYTCLFPSAPGTWCLSLEYEEHAAFSRLCIGPPSSWAALLHDSPRGPAALHSQPLQQGSLFHHPTQ